MRNRKVLAPILAGAVVIAVALTVAVLTFVLLGWHSWRALHPPPTALAETTIFLYHDARIMGPQSPKVGDVFTKQWLMDKARDPRSLEDALASVRHASSDEIRIARAAGQPSPLAAEIAQLQSAMEVAIEDGPKGGWFVHVRVMDRWPGPDARELSERLAENLINMIAIQHDRHLSDCQRMAAEDYQRAAERYRAAESRLKVFRQEHPGVNLDDPGAAGSEQHRVLALEYAALKAELAQAKEEGRKAIERLRKVQVEIESEQAKRGVMMYVYRRPPRTGARPGGQGGR